MQQGREINKERNTQKMMLLIFTTAGPVSIPPKTAREYDHSSSQFLGGVARMEFSGLHEQQVNSIHGER